MQRNGSVEIIPHRILVESKTEKEKKQKQKTKMQEMKYVRKKKNNKRDIHQLYEQRKDKAIPKHKPTTESDGAYIYIYIYISTAIRSSSLSSSLRLVSSPLLHNNNNKLTNERTNEKQVEKEEFHVQHHALPILLLHIALRDAL
jgi:hypothetical protein